MLVLALGCASVATDDTGTPPSDGFDGRLLLVPHGRGITLYDADGGVAGSASWTELVGDCRDCGGEGASADGDGLLVSFTTGPGNEGDVARVGGDGALDFRVGPFEFPHDAVRDPADGAVLVPEATANRIRWIDGDGGSAGAVRLLDEADPGWPGEVPNGVTRFDHDGRSWLLVSHRGLGGGGPPATRTASGAITLWDVTDPAAPALAWRFPGKGELEAPHGAVLRAWGGRWWLLWAHTFGAPDGGSVGVAVTDDPAAPPAYVADLVPDEPFVYLRGVELASDGRLVLTDSGQLAGSGGPGRIVRAPFPADLAPTGATGSVDEDQVLLGLEDVEPFADGLERPFEGWLWTPTFGL